VFAAIQRGCGDLGSLSRMYPRNAPLTETTWQFEGVMSNVPMGIALYDSSKKLAFCNQMYRDLYGFQRDTQLLGKTADELTRMRLDAGVFGDVSHAEFLRARSENMERMDTWQQTLRDGRVIEVKQTGVANGRVVITHTDVTAREKLLAELELQNANLEITIGNIGHGICLLDRDLQVILANDLYADLYGLTPEEVRPGVQLCDIVRRRVQNGLIVDGTAEDRIFKFRKMLFKNAVAEFVDERKCGHKIRVRYRRLDRGGWVVTHQDITESENLRKRLDSALNNVAQGI
jgi:PAS domain-containing protein